MYIVEGRRVSKTEAYEIPTSKIAAIEVSGAVAGVPNVIEVRTVDGARRAQEVEGQPIRIVGRRGAGEPAPMVLLDGVRAKLEELNKLDPKNIASIEVLKGAGAVAQYGADATNGVITVKTKKE